MRRAKRNIGVPPVAFALKYVPRSVFGLSAAQIPRQEDQSQTQKNFSLMWTYA
jgi:hypothetical protein